MVITVHGKQFKSLREVTAYLDRIVAPSLEPACCNCGSTVDCKPAIDQLINSDKAN